MLVDTEKRWLSMLVDCEDQPALDVKLVMNLSASAPLALSACLLQFLASI